MQKIHIPKEQCEALEHFSATVYRFDDAAEAAAHIRANLHKGDAAWWQKTSAWTGGHQSNEQSVQYATTGNDALVETAQRFLSKIEASGFETVRHEWHPSPCGAYPIVPDAIVGRPDAMRRRREAQGERAPVRVVADTTSSAGISASDLEKRGAAILAFVMLLTQERPVELWQVTTFDAPDTSYLGIMTRCPTMPLNIGVCAHLLTSVNWTRSLGYKYLRQHENGVGAWAFGIMPSGKDSDPKMQRFCKLVRASLDLEPQDIYVPAIGLSDDLIRDPVAWINRTLAKVREEFAEQ